MIRSIVIPMIAMMGLASPSAACGPNSGSTFCADGWIAQPMQAVTRQLRNNAAGFQGGYPDSADQGFGDQDFGGQGGDGSAGEPAGGFDADYQAGDHQQVYQDDGQKQPFFAPEGIYVEGAVTIEDGTPLDDGQL